MFNVQDNEVNMNKLIVPTGYMGSGSSAITDLLSEYNSVDATKGSFEYVFLHCPNGLFDLEDKLLLGNTSLRSDEAIHSFLETMYELYKKDGHWINNYKEQVSTDFYAYCLDFISQLAPFKFDNVYWYYQQNPRNMRMKMQLLLLRLTKKITRNKKQFRRPIYYKETYFAYPTDKEFFAAAKIFLEKVFSALGINKNNIVADQLLLPQNVYRIDRYFDDNVRVIIVDRDPRDVFILNKYFWKPKDQMVPLPLDACSFSNMYRKIREMKTFDDQRILKIHFEDLVYNYKNTVNNIESFLDLNANEHYKQFQFFKPEKSIVNTQLFNHKEFAQDEINTIKEQLSDYLYEFPYSLSNELISREVF